MTGFAEGESSIGKYVREQMRHFPGGSPMATTSPGPCTDQPHHYTFVLIATDFDPKDLPPGLTHDDVTAKFGPVTASRTSRA